MDSLQPSRRDQPPYNPPSPGDRLFYLLLTATATTVVYKSFPNRIRGISAIAVGSFGLYHSFGLTCDCIKKVVSKFFDSFGGSGSSSGGGFWGCFSFPRFPQPWDNHVGRWTPSSTSGVDRSKRQEKRPKNPDRQWEEEAHQYRSTSWSSSPHQHKSSSFTAVDFDQRQQKRVQESTGSHRSPVFHQSSYEHLRSHNGNQTTTYSFDPGQRQEKRRSDTSGLEFKDPWKQ